ncbi:helix-turn-helix domain-containing protein [Lentibacter algarum]|uniref:helix-turn-helix domain-containing protein n=1 Tax=Lentibacter algarum TaxID=576131 RepID=UPI001C0A5498|nr:helix-turn-helix domain-containing protein [Lentibacter algarum]MBU2983160.1 helix-turn-helix domain-containing protein [Lentibacter algarum]
MGDLLLGTVSNALKILKYFTESSNELGLSEISRLTGQNKTTAYRYLCELESNSFVEQNSKTKGYRLGPAVSNLARLSNSGTLGLHIFRQILAAVSEEASCWAFLYPGQPGPLKPLLVFHQGAQQDGAFQKVSPYSSPGVCLFAACDIAPSDVTHSDLNEQNWDEAVSAFRAQGVAPSPQPNAPAISFSAPIFDAAGSVSSIVTLARPRQPSKQNQMPLKSAVLLAARSGTAAIGGAVPSSGDKTKPTRSHLGRSFASENLAMSGETT